MTVVRDQFPRSDDFIVMCAALRPAGTSNCARFPVDSSLKDYLAPSLGGLPNRLSSIMRRDSPWRQELNGDGYGRSQVCKGHPHPHKRACPLLIVECRIAERRNVGEALRRQVRGVNHSVAEREKCGKRVARQRGEEEVQGY